MAEAITYQVVAPRWFSFFEGRVTRLLSRFVVQLVSATPLEGSIIMTQGRGMP